MAEKKSLVCEHGSLARSCVNCELIEVSKERDALLAVAREIDSLLANTGVMTGVLVANELHKLRDLLDAAKRHPQLKAEIEQR